MTTAYDAPHDEIDESPGSNRTRIALAIVVALMAAMWIWIYLFAPRDNPDRLATREFAAAAEAICSPAQERVNALPLPNNDITVEERARDVGAATDITIEMVAALKVAAATVTDPDDLRILELWFEDWDAYILDRESFVTRLEAADLDAAPTRDLRFTLTERAEGGIYTRRIDGLANVNDMASCHVPGDV